MTRKAIIYRPAKSAMQSGTQNTQYWRVELPSDAKVFVDQTMGWIGGTDTMKQVKLKFHSQQEAEQYVKAQGYEPVLREPKLRVVKPKSYANNFATDKRRYSDIAAQNRIEL